jgi:hypothetical protein
LSKEKAYPFKRSTTGWWDGDQSQKTETFGYIYQDAAIGSAQQVKQNFRDKYSWLTRGAPEVVPDSKSIPSSMKPVYVDDKPFFQSRPVARVAETARMAAQPVFNLMKSAQATITGSSAVSALVAEPKDSASNVDTTPVAPGEAATDVAFTNMVPEMTKPVAKPLDEDHSKREWYIDQVVERYVEVICRLTRANIIPSLGLNTSFTTYYFIGAFDNNAVHDYALQPTLAALNHNFTSSVELCDNCGTSYEGGQLISGTNVITPILLDYVKVGVLPDIGPDNVVPFLITNLKWRVVTVCPRSLQMFDIC